MPSPEYKVSASRIQPAPWGDLEHQFLSRPTFRTPLMDSNSIRAQYDLEQRQPLLPPPTDFQNDTTTDTEEASFDSILASLQSLAFELEKDFEVGTPPKDSASIHGYLSNSPSNESDETLKARSTSDLSFYEKRSP